MRLIFTILSVVVFSLLVSAQSGQDVQRYSYHMWGTVLDEELRTMPHLSLYFLRSERPII